MKQIITPKSAKRELSIHAEFDDAGVYLAKGSLPNLEALSHTITITGASVQVNMTKQRIEVYWMRDPRGVVWLPFSGGPIYHQAAMDEANWLLEHLEEFRCLLPKQIRDWPIVLGELSTSTYPGIFRETPARKEPHHV